MMKKVLLVLFTLCCFTLGTAAFAISGIGSVATQVTTNISAIAKLVTAAAYVAGMAFAVTGIVKFKQHKDQPTQYPISTPIAFIFIGAALIFVPSIFSVSGHTLFGSSGQVSSVSGLSSFRT
ncbi:MAG: type IV secretion protein IcmD [Gammaproteobacteria bacterium]|nr:MAG: type IV secretion protein IcmD [Gammaproteobacteria bacterium]